LIRFVFKRRVSSIANRYIESLSLRGDFYEVRFVLLEHILYWPKLYHTAGIYQVVSETFDSEDWHYYQKYTMVENGEVLLDIGAAEGLFALTVAERCKQIILVEPNISFVRSLQKSFAWMGARVDIFNVAVGDSSGTVSFDQDSLRGGVSTAGSSGVSVKLTRIDDFIGSDVKVTFLKADIEGFELDMLKGARNLIERDRPKIAVTTYHLQNDADEIISFVKGVVPEYQVAKKGIIHKGGKPVMVHFWI